jgi:hypothetical protein
MRALSSEHHVVKLETQKNTNESAGKIDLLIYNNTCSTVRMGIKEPIINKKVKVVFIIIIIFMILRFAYKLITTRLN